MVYVCILELIVLVLDFRCQCGTELETETEKEKRRRKWRRKERQMGNKQAGCDGKEPTKRDALDCWRWMDEDDIAASCKFLDEEGEANQSKLHSPHQVRLGFFILRG